MSYKRLFSTSAASAVAGKRVGTKNLSPQGLQNLLKETSATYPTKNIIAFTNASPSASPNGHTITWTASQLYQHTKAFSNALSLLNVSSLTSNLQQTSPEHVVVSLAAFMQGLPKGDQMTICGESDVENLKQGSNEMSYEDSDEKNRKYVVHTGQNVIKRSLRFRDILVYGDFAASQAKSEGKGGNADPVVEKVWDALKTLQVLTV